MLILKQLEHRAFSMASVGALVASFASSFKRGVSGFKPEIVLCPMDKTDHLLENEIKDDASFRFDEKTFDAAWLKDAIVKASFVPPDTSVGSGRHTAAAVAACRKMGMDIEVDIQTTDRKTAYIVDRESNLSHDTQYKLSDEARLALFVADKSILRQNDLPYDGPQRSLAQRYWKGVVLCRTTGLTADKVILALSKGVDNAAGERVTGYKAGDILLKAQDVKTAVLQAAEGKKVTAAKTLSRDLLRDIATTAQGDCKTLLQAILDNDEVKTRTTVQALSSLVIKASVPEKTKATKKVA